ncbi:MAG: hypothetical protein GX242_03380 [Clostridiales bacterium]|nr:hypothetical protein [Clostridiales bacterium]
MKYSIEQLKKQPYFKIGDIIIYALVAIITITLSVVFLIPKEDRALDKVCIYYKDALIYEYDFTSGKGKVTDGYQSYVAEQTKNDKTLVTISTKDGENEVEIAKAYALMAKSDCSSYADCVRSFRPIRQGGDMIICLPNNIRIIGEGKVLQNEIRL